MAPIEITAAEILKTYEGFNNQILEWKKRGDIKNSYILTRAQADYVVKYHDIKPKIVRKQVKIEDYIGKKMMEDRMLTSVPEEIYVEKLLAESDKAFHFMAKVTEGSRFEYLWIPKSMVIKSNNRVVNVDFEKYKDRPPLTHQVEAVVSLLKNDKFILADDMGLGKTTSAVISSLESNSSKILIICPATLKINWKREIKNYSNESVYIVDGKHWEEGHKYYIINYDILKNFHEIPTKKKKKGEEEELTVEENELKNHIIREGFDLVIIDEAHYISNSEAKRTQLINDITNNVKKLWLLTGTPITSRPINYYNLLKLIDCPLSYNWVTYAKRYCKGYQFTVKGRKIWNVTGASNLDELRDRTKPYVLRRLKEEVLDLPDKIITPIYLELKSRLYEDEMGEYYKWNDKEGKDESIAIQLNRLMVVRQIISKEKIPYTIELIEKMLELDKKVIVFTNFTETLEIIAGFFKGKAVQLDGRMSAKKKQESVDRFQTDPKAKIFVSNLKAGGVGITLTEAEAVIMNDLSFVPAEHSQGEDRTFRYGQKKNISVYYPIFENTIEQVMFNILGKKKSIIDTVMGDNIEYSTGFGSDLMKQLKR